MRKKIIILLVLALTLTIVVTESYSYYKSKTTVNVTTSGSKVICVAEVDNKKNYKSKYGYAEIKLNIKNYVVLEEEDGVEKKVAISPLPFDYKVKVTNYDFKDDDDLIQNDIEGIFGYNHKFPDENEDLIFTGSINNTANKTTNEHRIQVKTDKDITEEVNYKIEVECIQRNPESDING